MVSALPSAICIRNLRKRYGSLRHPIDALNGLDLAVEKGDVFGFLGPNGAGKTTTIRILATIISPTGGNAEVEGHDTCLDSMAVRRAIGYVSEMPSTYPLLTGLGNLVYWGWLQGMTKADARRKAKELLAEFGLAEAETRKAKTYSHGMRRRLSVAQALLHDPSILLFDEPAGGLDPQGIRFLRDLMGRLHGQGKTLFLSSHLLSEVEQICRTIGVIDSGRVVAVGSVDSIRKRIIGAVPVRIEIECDSPTHAAWQAIGSLPSIRNTLVTSKGFVVEAESGSDVVDDINRILVSEHVRVMAIRPEEPTLEDAFLSILQEETHEP